MPMTVTCGSCPPVVPVPVVCATAGRPKQRPMTPDDTIAAVDNRFTGNPPPTLLCWVECLRTPVSEPESNSPEKPGVFPGANGLAKKEGQSCADLTFVVRSGNTCGVNC